ncbi:helix-turn-helix transcriptional regulator [Streptomyces sp. 8N616]|uniref:helix-turn-helix transcriptional regulator n=1 Tax=Streptomyces sp. 8N616 TaxID=3457414 RepID=UPI003FD4F53A
MGRLSDVEIDVFRWTTQHGHLTVEAAALDLELTVEVVQQAATALTARHLLRPLQGAEAETRLVSVAPETAAATLLASIETSLRSQLAQTEELRGDYNALVPLYAEIQQTRRHHTPIEEVRDTKTVVKLIDDAIAHCRVEVITCEPSREQPTELVEHASDRDLALLRRGVQMRTLYQHTARHDTTTQEYVKQLASTGAQVRTLPELFGRMIAIDQKIAFISHRNGQDGAVIIRDPSTVSYLWAVFEHSWILATPLNPGHFGTPTISTEAKQAIVRLLTEGMKDEVIARRLSMSLRTCRKHIAEIMESFRAESRFQLGYLIRARLGDASSATAGHIDSVVDAACSTREGKDGAGSL